MNMPARPAVQHQGPANHCVVHGILLGWTSCTAYATAMGIVKSSLSRYAATGCGVRTATGDTSGGTTIPQCNRASIAAYGTAFEEHVGANTATPAHAASNAHAGRGFVLQGNTSALIHTVHRSTGGPVNHAVWVNETRGGTTDEPEEALVYDPAADGRVAGWGTAASSPQWWPWKVVKAFAAALRPWGDADSRTLGPGRFYCMFGADTEPHAHLHFGATRTVPFPDKTVGNAPVGRKSNIRSTPMDLLPGHVIGHLARGASFPAFQKVTNGALAGGSRVWYGDHNGTHWVHESGLAGEGGAS